MSLERALELQERSWQLESEGRLDEAARALREAIGLMELAEGSQAPDVANLLNELGAIENDRGDFDSATGLGERAWQILVALESEFTGEEATHIRIRTLSILGAACRSNALYADGERYLKLALELARGEIGDDSEAAARARNELGMLYRYWGRFVEAAELYNRARISLVATHGENSLECAALYHNMGGLAHARGDFEQAAAFGLQAWEISRAALGEDDPRALLDAIGYGAALEGLGRYAESEQRYREAWPGLEKRLGARHLEIANLLHNLGAVVEARGGQVGGPFACTSGLWK
ncbi:MAG: tetratricopeptide repeat protein [Gammaproteobacteria bacterium]